MKPHISKIMTYQEKTKCGTKPRDYMAKGKITIMFIGFNKNFIKSSNNPINLSLKFSLLQEKIDELKLYRPPTIDPEENEVQESNEEIDEGAPLQRSNRVPQTPIRLQNYATYKIRYSIENFISYDNVTPEYKVFLASIENHKELNNFEETVNQPIWCEAMREELDALEKNNTWKIMQLPQGKKFVGCK
jgi:hypothetical protein